MAGREPGGEAVEVLAGSDGMAVSSPPYIPWKSL